MRLGAPGGPHGHAVSAAETDPFGSLKSWFRRFGSALAIGTARKRRASVGPALHELQQRTGHTVHFAVLDGDAATYVEKVEGTRPYQMASRVGMAVPPHCTAIAIAKAILSRLRNDEVRAVLDRTGLERRTPHTITSVKAMQRELELVREQGWALDNEENEAGIRCVGAPVLDHRGRVSGAISISTLALEFSEADAHAAAPFVIDTATRTSEALGAPEPAAPGRGVRPTRVV